MAEINADVNDVLQSLSQRLAGAYRENAVLLAQLSTAKKMIDEFEATASEPEVIKVDSGKSK